MNTNTTATFSGWKRSDIQRYRIHANDGRDLLDETNIGVWIVKEGNRFVLRAAIFCGNPIITETSRSQKFLKLLGQTICEWSAETDVVDAEHRRIALRNCYHAMWTYVDNDFDY